MSYPSNLETAKSDGRKVAKVIDSLDETSPIMTGSMGAEAGGAPMEGKKEFTKERTRTGWQGNQGGQRREFPTEGVSKK